MQRLISERIKNKQGKIKSSAEESKTLIANQKNSIKKEQLLFEKKFMYK